MLTSSTDFEPRSQHFVQRIQDSFSKQKIMQHMHASLGQIDAGRVTISMPFQAAFTQQNGYLHAGAIATIVDSACGYAALSLMPDDADVLSIEFKVNLLSPAIGEHFLAVGQVLKAGRNITVTEGALFADPDTRNKRVASMTATMMCIS